MRVAVQDLPGVTGAEVSLKDGLVVIDLEPENDVAIADVRKAIRDQGFSPRAADVRVAGRLEARGGGLALRVPGPGSVYGVTAPEEMIARLRAEIGEEIVLSGTVPRTDGADDSTTIRIVAVAEP